MGDGIFLLEVMTVIRGDDRDLHFAGQGENFPVGDNLVVESVGLHFEEIPVLSEDVPEDVGGRVGPVPFAPCQKIGDLAFQAPGKGDESLPVTVEEFVVGPGTIVETFEMGKGDDFEKIFITG